MDPDVARSKMIELANMVIAVDGDVEPGWALDLAEAVHDLDVWLRGQGAFPIIWAMGRENDARIVQVV